MSIADLVFIQDPVCVQPLINCLRNGKKPWTMYIHGLDWEVFPKLSGKTAWKRWIPTGAKIYCRFWYNRAHQLFTPSQGAKASVQKIGVSTPIRVIPHGVAPVHFHPPKNIFDLRKHLGLPPKALIVLYHGRIAEDRNLPLLIQACRHLMEDFPTLYLLLIGNGLPEEIRKIEALMQDGIQMKRIPAQNPVTPWVQASDIFCLLSSSETFSLSTVEAMACGKTVLVPRLPCLQDYIEDNKEGIFLKEISFESLTKTLADLLRSKEKRLQLGWQAKERVVQTFSWQKTADQLTESFTSLLRDSQNGQNV